jgi:hypothetical protein
MYFILIYISLFMTIINIIIKAYIVFNTIKNPNKVKIAVQIYSTIMHFLSYALFLPILSKEKIIYFI